MSRWFTVVSLVVAPACASVGGVRNAGPEAGKARWFDTSGVELLEVARNVLVSSKYKIREEKQASDTTWYIIGTQGSRFDELTWGPPYVIMRIRVVGSRLDSAQVWVHTKGDPLGLLDRAGMTLTRIGRELCFRRLRAKQPSAKPSSSACAEPREDTCPSPPSPLLNHSTEGNPCSDRPSSHNPHDPES